MRPQTASLAFVIGATLLLAIFAGWALLMPSESTRHRGEHLSELPEFRVEPTPQPPAHLAPRLAPPSSSQSDPGPPATQAAHVAGVVLGGQGLEPVEGAVVYVLNRDESFADPALTTASDADGRFQIPLGVVESGTALCIIAPGYVTHSQSLRAGTGGQPLRILLSRGVAIRGLVLDEAGEPVSHARVWCYLRRHTYGWPHTDEVYAHAALADGNVAESDSAGRFTVMGLRPEVRYLVRASKDGFTQVEPGTATPRAIEAPSGGLDLTLRLVREALVPVTIIDKASGKRVAFPRISAFYPPALAPATRDSREFRDADRPGHLLLRCVRGRAHTGAGPDPRIIVRAEALGYNPVESQVAADLGARTNGVVELTRQDPDPGRGDVSFSAVFSDSTPFTGPLGMSIWRMGVRGLYSDRVSFEEGRSKQTYSFPVGRYLVAVGGWGTHGDWWHTPTERFEFEVLPQPSVQTCSILLRGGRIELDVVAPDGTRVRGFGLDVIGEGDPGGMWFGWDRPDLEDKDGRGGPPWVWMNPGRVRVRANMPGVGLGEADVMVPDSGAAVRVRVELRAGQQIEK